MPTASAKYPVVFFTIRTLILVDFAHVDLWFVEDVGFAGVV
jgi:hypothetical protein